MSQLLLTDIVTSVTPNYKVESTRMNKRYFVGGLIAFILLCLAFSDHKRLLYLLGLPTTLVPEYSGNNCVDQTVDVPLCYMEDDNHSNLSD